VQVALGLLLVACTPLILSRNNAANNKPRAI
jgi:hypothetical protein